MSSIRPALSGDEDKGAQNFHKLLIRLRKATLIENTPAHRTSGLGYDHVYGSLFSRCFASNGASRQEEQNLWQVNKKRKEINFC